MSQQITVLDESMAKIGTAFPRRAKQLVNKNKARWSDETHTEIILLEEQTGGFGMHDTLIVFIETELNAAPPDSVAHMVKDAILDNLRDKQQALVAAGLDAEAAAEAVIANTSDITKLAEHLARRSSFVADAYRDEASVVLTSAPVEIIRKSKKRTRELHMAFSAMLWVGAAILYFGLSYMMGHRGFTLDVTKLAGTWLIFVAAAFIECGAEVYFCRKELLVLNENIDLRQINPASRVSGDLDLRGYQKSLNRKIVVMTHCMTWIPLALLYLICGYVFNLWHIAWVVFLVGVFAELVRNFWRKLKPRD